MSSVSSGPSVRNRPSSSTPAPGAWNPLLPGSLLGKNCNPAPAYGQTETEAPPAHTPLPRQPEAADVSKKKKRAGTAREIMYAYAC